MGNGVSGDQGNLPSYGKRDVRATFDRKQYDWSEQARAQEVNSLSSSVNSHIGAQRGAEEENVNSRRHAVGRSHWRRLSHRRFHFSSCRWRSSARIGTRPQDLKLPTNSMEEDGDDAIASYTDTSGAGPSAAKDDIYCDAMPYWKSSVMKDDTQSVMYGNTGLRNRKKKEDRSLKTEESKTKGNMQVETDTGQNACTLRRQKTGSVMQVEPDTGQTAYTSPSMTIPLPEEDRRTLLLSRLPSDETEEETSIESSLSMLQLGDTVDKLLPEPQVYNFRSKPETEIESSEKPDSASYEQRSCKEPTFYRAMH